MKKLFFLTLALCMLYHARAATYYFSSSGNDNSNGTNAATPFQNLSKLNAILASLQAGDVILFKRGDVFYGTLPMKTGVKYDAYGNGANPKITAFTTLIAWTNEGSGKYSTPLNIPFYLNTVSINGVLQQMGRFPNNTWKTYTSHNGNGSITDPTLTGNWTNAEAVIRKNRWIIDRHKITSGNTTTLGYTSTSTTDNPLKTASNYAPADGWGYFIQNSLATLDAFGEWYHDRTTNKLYVYFGNSNPANYSVKASTIERMVDMTAGVSNTAIRNIDFEGANSYGIQMVGTSFTAIVNCGFYQMGGYAIRGDGTNDKDTIINNVFSDINSNGMLFENCSNSRIYGNTVMQVATKPGMMWSGDSKGVGISTEGDGNIIRQNKLAAIGYNGIYWRGNNNFIDSNHVDGFGMVKDDCGGIYTYKGPGAAYTGSKIRRNVVLNGIGAPAGAKAGTINVAHGIYLDGAASNIEISNNSVAYISAAGLYNNYGSFNSWLNNTTFDCMEAMQFEEDTAGTIHDNVVTGNNFIAKQSNQLIYLHNMWATNSPDYVNFATFSNNIYSKPIAQTSAIMSMNFQNGSNNTTATLTQWKSLVSDATSKGSSTGVTNPNSLVFRYATNTSVKLNFCALFTGVDDQPIMTRLVIPAYSSKAYIK